MMDVNREASSPESEKRVSRGGSGACKVGVVAEAERLNGIGEGWRTVFWVQKWIRILIGGTGADRRSEDSTRKVFVVSWNGRDGGRDGCGRLQLVQHSRHAAVRAVC